MNDFNVFADVVFFVSSRYKHHQLVFHKNIAMLFSRRVAMTNTQYLERSRRLIVDDVH